MKLRRSEEEIRKKWAEIKQKGKARYIWRKGILTNGTAFFVGACIGHYLNPNDDVSKDPLFLIVLAYVLLWIICTSLGILVSLFCWYAMKNSKFDRPPDLPTSN
jgi:hypothetical protein